MADTYYISSYTGAQMDEADDRSLGPDATPTAGSDNLVTSGGVFDAVQGAAPAVQETASGAAAYIKDGSASPVASLISNITAVQAGSGTPSPSNPRAISGFTGATIRAAGKNLVYIPDGSGSNQSITFSCSGGVVTLTGIATGNAWRTISDDFILKAGTYRLSGGGQSNTYISLRTASGNTNIANTANGDITFTLAADTAVRLRAYAANGTDLSGGKTYYPQIEFGSTTTAWEAFAGKIMTFDWSGDAGTVYGGTLNVTTGVLTVTMGYIASYAGETINEPWISSIDEYVPNTSPSTGAEVAYTLATPQTYQLTAEEVDTLLGINNIWADTGDVEVAYRADTALFIAEKVPDAPTTDGTYTLTATVSGGVATYSWS